MYEASDTYAEALEDTLKERVFDHVFLELATGLYNDHQRRTDGEIERVRFVLAPFSFPGPELRVNPS